MRRRGQIGRIGVRNASSTAAASMWPYRRQSVTSRRGSVEVRAQVGDTPRDDTTFLAFHWRECPANALTNPALDPIAKIPEFKVCAVKLEKV